MTSKSTDDEYFETLRDRLAESRRLILKQGVNIDGWAPSARCCHANVVYYAERMAGWKPVRGWIVQRISGRSPKLVPHSVLRQEGSEDLIDITPPDGFEPIRWEEREFITHIGTDGEFMILACRYPDGPSWL